MINMIYTRHPLKLKRGGAKSQLSGHASACYIIISKPTVTSGVCYAEIIINLIITNSMRIYNQFSG